MLTLVQHKLVIPLVFDVNLYFFIKGNLRIPLKSRKLLLKSTNIDLNSHFRTVSYGFPGFPGPRWRPPGPPRVSSQKVQRVREG